MNTYTERIKKVFDLVYKDVNNTIDTAQENLHDRIQQYRKDKNSINYSKDYSDKGKENKIQQLREKYYNNAVNTGDSYIEQIEQIYNTGIEEIEKIKGFKAEDQRGKEITATTETLLKDNIDLQYAIFLLNSIEKKEDFKFLDSILNTYQDNSKILDLIQIKVNKLFNDDTKVELTDIKNTLDDINRDYIKELNNKKIFHTEKFKNKNYPYKMFDFDLKDTFEINKITVDSFFK